MASDDGPGGAVDVVEDTVVVVTTTGTEPVGVLVALEPPALPDPWCVDPDPPGPGMLNPVADPCPDAPSPP